MFGQKLRHTAAIVAVAILGSMLGVTTARGAEPAAPARSQSGEKGSQSLLEVRARAWKARDWKTVFPTLSPSEQDEAVVDVLLVLGLLGDAGFQKIADKYVDWPKLDALAAGEPEKQTDWPERRKRIVSCVSNRVGLFTEACARLSEINSLSLISDRFPGERPTPSRTRRVTSADVVVRRLDAEVSQDRGDAWRFLWQRFVNKPEELQFRSVRTKDWKATFKEYRGALVEKAKSQKLDGKSLDLCLGEVLRDASAKKDDRRPALAYLPVGAYLAKQGATLVWIVAVRWELEGPREPGGEQAFGHVRVYAMDAKSQQTVGFCTCD